MMKYSSFLILCVFIFVSFGTSENVQINQLNGQTAKRNIEQSCLGNLNSDASTFNRVEVDSEGTPVQLSFDSGTAVRFRAWPITFSNSGVVRFTMTTNEVESPVVSDTYMLLYSGEFSSISPMTNVIIGNDDYLNQLSTSSFLYEVVAGVEYTVVFTGFDNIDGNGNFKYIVSSADDSQSFNPNFCGQAFTTGEVTSSDVGLTTGLTTGSITTARSSVTTKARATTGTTTRSITSGQISTGRITTSNISTGLTTRFSKNKA